MKLHFVTLIVLFVIVFSTEVSPAATVETIGPENRFPLQGKETDWIDGDYVLANDKLVAVIARPGAMRDANMTVRGVGACLIDLTRRDIQSDQLSCFYPAAGRFQFHDDALVEHGKMEDGGVFWRCRSTKSLSVDGAVAVVEYQLRDGDSFVTVVVRLTGGDFAKFAAADGVRADRTFKFGALAGTTTAYCEDEAFMQTYGFRSVCNNETPKWDNQRLKKVIYAASPNEPNDGEATWTTQVIPASSAVDLWGLCEDAAPQTFVVAESVGDQPRIKLTVLEGDLGPVSLPATWRSNADGKSIVHLPPGNYRVRAEAIGHEATETMIRVDDQPAEHPLKLGSASRVVVNVTDSDGNRSPCKVTFYGRRRPNGKTTTDPIFGLDSQSGSVGNCVYSADGAFVRSIPPGSYDVLISRGPEFDALFKTIQIKPGSEVALAGVLKRVVDTTGWVSAELHSHSSPSGDNTSDQLGRVENLVCEHLEFAPCTEHQRIESYDDQLELLQASPFMATCSGMELTGSMLPINHQNAFPLKWNPFGQDGGGPRTSGDPVEQIARLAMWDDNAEKIVQTNHPNMRQLLHDRDLDGQSDGGFAKMLGYMDLIEVHPPEDIFLTAKQTAAKGNPDENRIKPWMDLLKSGRRLPGVVNTDAHYNWNGSGWLRNWIRCSTDNPAKISTDEMIERLEGGQIVMSTGPFLSVQLHHPDLDEPAEIGDSIEIDGDSVELAVKVQCPNWLNVNRVEVFVNGESRPDLARTRADHPDLFGNGVVKFDQRLTVDLPEDAFIIVATIGDRMQLGRVMGSNNGRRPPVAVSNPIYVKTK